MNSSLPLQHNSGNSSTLLSQLLPLQSLGVCLEFVRHSQFRFHHNSAVNALIRRLIRGNTAAERQMPFANSELSRYLLIDVPENGRLEYQPGELYHFSIIALPGSEALLFHLVNRLKALPVSLADNNKKSDFFTDNIRLHQLTDNFTQQVITDTEDLSQYAEQQLQTESAIWQQQQHFTWHWLSPAKILKAKNNQQRYNDDRYCADASDLSGELLFNRLYDACNTLLRERQLQVLPPRPPAPKISQQQHYCFWVDSHNKDEQMGGLLGHHAISLHADTDSFWYQLLILGQYLGLGVKRSYGWGRYWLQTDEGGRTYRRLAAAQSLLPGLLNESSLQQAWRDKKTSPINRRYKWQYETQQLEQDSSFYSDELPDSIRRRASQILAGEYQVPGLSGYLVDKPQGGIRALAVPPFGDRIIQRAVATKLGAMLDRLMGDRSFGYRKGYSRQSAADQIQRAYRQGAGWVLDADIDAFFDQVEHHHIACRLQALFPDDPLIYWLMQWLSAPVKFQQKTVQRDKGLPQGSPISPLLANLMLDDFDADMKRQGFNTIRFADDFIVTCKTQQQAEKAQLAALKSLNEHGLTLKKSKTRVTSFERGFHFIGYLFCNDLVLDVGSEYKQNDPHNAANKDQTSGWLAAWQQQHQTGAETGAEATTAAQRPLPVYNNQQPYAVGVRNQLGSLITITGKNCVLSNRNERLVVSREDETLINVPWRGLRAVLLLGQHHITHPAMLKALQHQVPIHLTDFRGRYQGQLSQGQPVNGHKLWLQQQSASNNHSLCLHISKEIINARIRHQQETLRQKGWPVPPQLGQALSQLQRASSNEQILGQEGLATRYYFSAIQNQLESQWQFNERNRRPPKDPVNVMLSLGYTCLHANVDALIQVDGLCPQIGFLHRSHGRFSALAADLMEPFRHIVERTTLTLINTQQIKVGDFSWQARGCIMAPQAKRLFLASLVSRFETQLKDRDGKAGTLCEHISWQNNRLKEMLRGQGVFKAWRYR